MTDLQYNPNSDMLNAVDLKWAEACCTSTIAPVLTSIIRAAGRIGLLTQLLCFLTASGDKGLQQGKDKEELKSRPPPVQILSNHAGTGLDQDQDNPMEFPTSLGGEGI